MEQIDPSTTVPEHKWNDAKMDIRAHDRALLQFIADLPTAAELAAVLTPVQKAGLLTAVRTNDGWRALPEYVDHLRPIGLCEVGGAPGANRRTHNRLGPYGEEIRRYLVRQEGDLC
jgi:hypothetical protein